MKSVYNSVTCWVRAQQSSSSSPSIVGHYNCSSVARNTQGNYEIYIDTDAVATTYAFGCLGVDDHPGVGFATICAGQNYPGNVGTGNFFVGFRRKGSTTSLDISSTGVARGANFIAVGKATN